jgi:hypothetical protein
MDPFIKHKNMGSGMIELVPPCGMVGITPTELGFGILWHIKIQ